MKRRKTEDMQEGDVVGNILLSHANLCLEN